MLATDKSADWKKNNNQISPSTQKGWKNEEICPQLQQDIVFWQMDLALSEYTDHQWLQLIDYSRWSTEGFQLVCLMEVTVPIEQRWPHTDQSLVSLHWSDYG